LAAWGGDAGARPAVAELQLARLALAARDAALAARCGADAIGALEAESYPAAAALGEGLLSLLEDTAMLVPPRLLAKAAGVIQAAGDGATADALLEKGMATLERSAEQLDPMEAGHLLLEHADRLVRTGDLERAVALFQKAATLAEKAGEPINLAVARGRIADILEARGQLDAALRIRMEEELPVCERLGDMREKLVCRAKIALSLMQRGKGEDRASANALLCLALGDARHLRIPEAEQIAQILQHFDMDCGS
jgi:tetratricopeptide (TPR) repeat protein